MRKELLFSVVALGLLLGSTSAMARSNAKSLVNKELKDSKKSFKQAPKEILNGLRESYQAISALQSSKIDEAKKSLKEATVNFDKALKTDPGLDLVPIDERFGIYENLATPKEIEHILSETKKAIDEHKLDEARVALNTLKDEMDIEITSIPMKLFPDATKKALDELNKGHKDKAMMILAEAYSTFVTVEANIPLSLLSAQELIVQVASIDKSKKDEAIKLLNEAQSELKKAELLGYTDKKSKEYKEIFDAIDNIKKEIKGKNAVEKLYDKLKESFRSLVHKSKTETHKQAEAKVNTFEKKESQKALSEAGKFSSDSKSDESKTIK